MRGSALSRRALEVLVGPANRDPKGKKGNENENENENENKTRTRTTKNENDQERERGGDK